MQDKPCRVGFIGGGAMIREHAHAFQDVAGVELSGITNRTRAKAELLAEELGIPAVYDTIDHMATSAEIDLVVIAVYEPAILKTAMAAFQHPWAVLMEKPIGLDLSEARQVATAAASLERRVWVGLNRRTLGATEAVLQDLAADPGARFIHVQDQQSLETARAIGHRPEVVDNWMFANSIHLADYLCTFGRGAITSVDVLKRFDPVKPGVVLAKVDFDSGDVGLYEALWHAPGPWACAVTTGRRRWEMRPLEKATYQNAGERTLNSVEIPPHDVAFKPGFRRQAEKVVSAWRGEKNDAPTVADALRTTELVSAIYSRKA